MDFKDQIRVIAERVAKLKNNIETEEATKNAFIMPFIQCLGYDVFNPLEVVPEYTCDIGTKKGEKIDYAILKNDEPIILIECKHWKEKLSNHNGQLLRYFHVSKAKFGVLTNGIIYRFYTDLESSNKMDDSPFFEVNMEDLRDTHIEKLKEFHTSYFSVDNILNTASELKYTNEIRSSLKKEIENPSDEFVKYFSKPLFLGRFNPETLDQFRGFVRQAFKQYVADEMNERLKSAISPDAKIDIITDLSKAVVPNENQDTESKSSESKIITTDEETQGFYIIKSILYDAIDDISRVVARDTQSYFGILLDDNNRKPICRLHFNSSNKYLEVIGEDKVSTKYLLSGLNDIYKYSDQIRNSLNLVLKI